MLKSNKPSRTIFAVGCIALMSTLIGCNVLDTKEDIYDTDEQIKNQLPSVVRLWLCCLYTFAKPL